MIEASRAWVRAESPQARHLERTWEWTLQLQPEASAELQVAALTHDMERAYPAGSPVWEPDRGWDDPLYNLAHCERSARLVGDFLRDAGVAEPSVREVVRLVLAHESGGWQEADLLQAADSLSFLETMPSAVAGWVKSGRTTREQARSRLQFAVDRIQLEGARELATSLLPKAKQGFELELADG